MPQVIDLMGAGVRAVDEKTATESVVHGKDNRSAIPQPDGVSYVPLTGTARISNLSVPQPTVHFSASSFA